VKEQLEVMFTGKEGNTNDTWAWVYARYTFLLPEDGDRASASETSYSEN